MTNVLIYQPYLSTRKLSSNTLERQFRFLKFNKNLKVYALLDTSEAAYAEALSNVKWLQPIVVNLVTKPLVDFAKLQEQYDFKALYISRTYFTPVTIENIDALKKFNNDIDDFRYYRNAVPMSFAKLNVPVHHIIYDPLELQYDSLINSNLYKKYSSMNNVKDAKCHVFADLGYYDLSMEVPFIDKKNVFTFGATAVDSDINRSALILDIYKRLHHLYAVKLFIRVGRVDTLVSNDIYEKEVASSLFTYAIPSYSPKHVSFTRMLLALSQGTMPLLHPDNNLDCLYDGFKYRKSLKEFFSFLLYSPEELETLMQKPLSVKINLYKELLKKWHSLEYYQLLQQNQIYNYYE